MQVPIGASRHAASTPSEVRVTAPARLHFGFVDLHGGLGRRFGSLGLAIDRPLLRVRARRATKTEVAGPSAERAARVVEVLHQQYSVSAAVRVEIEETIPPHSGLGSGTQIALATATAVCTLFGATLSVPELARSLERGARSGIGSGVFEHGGFVVDGGRGELDAPPPVISRLPFPEDWRVVLLFDPALTGLHGESEAAAFRNLPQFPERLAEHLARKVLMKLLPALAEGQLEQFGSALTEIQQVTGDHFAPAQGGRYASRRVACALQRLAEAGAAACGQSSWGPTGFAILGSQAAAEAAVQQSHLSEGDLVPLSIQIVRGSNRGAQCRPIYAAVDQAVTA